MAVHGIVQRLTADQEAARVKGGVGGGQFGKTPDKRVAENSVVDSFTWNTDPEEEPVEFMTSREILSQFGPLDNDRLYWYENGRGSDDHDETDDELWARKTREARTNTRRDRFPSDLGERPTAPSRTAPGFVNVGWTSSYPTAEYATLYDDIEANGIRAPISLQRNAATVGQAGKPEILGGLHRVAVMMAAHPDALIPVAFFDTLQDAKDQLGDQF